MDFIERIVDFTLYVMGVLLGFLLIIFVVFAMWLFDAKHFFEKRYE